MQALNLNLNADQSYFLIKIRKNLDSYLKNKIENSEGFVVINNDKVANISLQFDLILEDDSKITRVDSKGNSKRRKETFLQLKSISFEKINEEISFLKVAVTLNEITKIIELETSIQLEKHPTGKHKVIVDVVAEIDKKDFGLGVDEKLSINGLGFSKKINAEGKFEFSNN